MFVRDNLRSSQRIHFIPEWLAVQGLRQIDIVNNIDVDKGTVSRWCSGRLPSEEYLEPLADFFGIKLSQLFTNPGTVEPLSSSARMVSESETVARDHLEILAWRLIHHRSTDKLRRIIATIEAAFPQIERDEQ